MAEDGQTGRLAEARPDLEDLLDPVALEARLFEARARRAEAIARREAERASGNAPTPSSSVRPWPLQPVRREPTPSAPLPPQAPRPAGRVRPVLLTQQAVAGDRADPGEHPPFAKEGMPGGRDESPRAAKRALPRAALLFVAGLGLGAAGVVLALRPTAETPTQPVAEAPASPASAEVTLPEAPKAITTPPEAPSPGNALREATAPSPASMATPGPATPAPLAPPVPRAETTPPEMAPAGTVGDLLEAAGRDAASNANGDADRDSGGDTAPPAPPASGLPERVTVHYPASAQSTAMEVREALTAAGVDKVEAVQVGFAIGKSNVRYYHGSDRSAAEEAGALLASDLGGSPVIRDFTDYPTPTAPGRVEIWVAGEPRGSAAAKSREAAAPAPSAPRAEAGTDLAPGDQVREVQRILMERLARP